MYRIVGGGVQNNTRRITRASIFARPTTLLFLLKKEAPRPTEGQETEESNEWLVGYLCASAENKQIGNCTATWRALALGQALHRAQIPTTTSKAPFSELGLPPDDC